MCPITLCRLIREWAGLVLEADAVHDRLVACAASAHLNRALYEQQKNNAGQPVPMTLGWHIGTTDSTRYFFKEGGGGGFRCEMRVYPSEGIASVVIANNANFTPSRFLNTADHEFLSKKST